MQIYQLKPTVVVGIDRHVIKIFNSAAECEKEAERLNRAVTPLLDRCESWQYEMTVVKVDHSYSNVLVMEKAHGRPLVRAKDSRLVELAGQCLAQFHKQVFDIDGTSAPRLFGDFAIDHLFVDIKLKTIKTIDPGANFMTKGVQLEDMARFLFSVTEAYRYRPLLSAKLLKAFFDGYRKEKNVELAMVRSALDFRKRRSQEKYKMQKSPSRAVIGGLILNYNRLLIRWVLKC